MMIHINQSRASEFNMNYIKYYYESIYAYETFHPVRLPCLRKQ